MNKIVRACLVALLAAASAIVAPALASAAPTSARTAVTPSPSPSEVFACDVEEAPGDYAPPGPCELRATLLSPICDNEVPKLRYVVEAIGTPNTTVTITFINPTGADVVYADLPLSGTVNWPGAVEDENGRGIDWPGWTQLPDGTWVEGDEFDWVRPSVQVMFEVNPSLTASVAYPPSSPVCLTDPPTEPPTSPPELSSTGSDAGPVLLAGTGLLVAGAFAVALVARARRRNEA